ncbi:biofilm regulation diguanylate cyclase SiaD [Geoalkalibacter sp.]|uniref:biofilm regulation diguanylate cyclase SiaD n=1 Tax=Geoalkalibacter sp. TaxID=3041440 RepID=UPI00272ECAB7|nr:biofilm regulation diguanylate cyclase SiaD [Geoalkalibacter sp.]
MKRAERTETELLQHIRAQLADPVHAANPLRADLEALLNLCEAQRVRLERLIRISDGFHDLERSRNLGLIEQYDRQIQRLEKLTRISDRYQKHLRELNQELKQAVLRDPLTEIGNRRYLLESLKAECARVQRKGGGFSLALLDVDHFKTVNDRLGHETGDRVLREIARAIQAGLREYDLCGRWGGEEFLVMLPDTPLDTAVGVAERIRRNVSQIHFEQAGAPLPLTASLGLACHQPGEEYSATLHRADLALLRAKASGRNRVERID